MATKKAAPTKSKMDQFLEETEETPETAMTAPKAVGMTYSSTPNINPEDTFIPKLRLAQGLTAEVQNGHAKPGDWLISGEDPMKKPTIIPMMFSKRRELRDSDDSRTVHCRSFDSIVGQGDPGGECGKCPMAQWQQGKGKNAKNRPPLCTFLYSYVVYVVETQTLAILEFSRTSIPAGKMLNTIISQRGLGKVAIQLTNSSSKGPKGSYYSPQVTSIKVAEKVLKEANTAVQGMF